MANIPNLKEGRTFQFDDDYNLINSIAADICDVEFAMIHFTLQNKLQLFSHFGLSQKEITTDFLLFAAETVFVAKKAMVISDTRKSKLFKDNSASGRYSQILTFAGFPILDAQNNVKGVLSIASTQLKSITNHQILLLEKLAVQANEIFELKENRTSNREENITSLNPERILEISNQLSNTASWVYDIDKDIFSGSKKLYEIHEVSSDHIFNRFDTIKYYHPDYHDIVSKAAVKIIKYGIPFSYVALLITEKGNKRWVKSSAIKIENKIIGSLQDITDFKERELKFEGIFNSSISFIGFLNTKGVLLEVNKTALEVSGISKHDIVGKHIWDSPMWSDDEFKSRLKDDFKKALAGEEVVCEAKMNTMDGNTTTILFGLRPVFNEQKEVVYVIPEGRSIDKLTKARDRFKAVLEATRAAVWEWNVQTQVLMIDNLWAEMIGYTKEELEPITVKTWENLTHPQDLKVAEKELEKCFAKEIEYYNVEFRFKHKNGQWRWIKSYGRVMTWTPDGLPLMMYGAHIDITDKREQEEKLQDFLTTTEVQNNRLKNFAYIVSHNLRSHSQSMSGLLDLVINQTPEIPDHELIDMLYKNSKNLSQTVEDLNRVVMETDSKIILEKINVYDSITKNIETLFTQIKNSGISVKYDIDKSFEIKGVKAYVESVFFNFMSNAIKYRSTKRESFLHITAYKTDKYIVISFEDNGQGLDLEKHGDNLFGMYKTFHKNEDSRGIGLFITKSQIEQMNGKIEVSSKVDVGTTFKVFLPF